MRRIGLVPACVAAFTAATACLPAPLDRATGTAGTGDDDPDVWSAEIDGPCDLDPPAPSGLAVTTTDFATGAVSIARLDPFEVSADVALGSTDAIPFAPPSLGDRYLYVVHRYMYDRLEILDREDGYASVAEIPLADSQGPSTNPHAIAAGPDGKLFVTFFGIPAVGVVDPSAPAAVAWEDRIDLSALADEDGNPEASHAVACGSVLVVSLGRLDADAGFAPRGEDRLVAIDMTTRTLLPGRIDLLGPFPKQIRRDPSDPTGRTLLVLTTGIERIDLTTGTAAWAVPDTAFAQAGIDHRFLPQSFDVDASGEMAYVAAYTEDFDEVRLHRVGLDGATPAIPEVFATGFDSVERTLEVAGDVLYYGSTNPGAFGLLRFDLRTDPPVPMGEAVSTGLPPYALVALP
ncbi:MAG: hypothetical protein D6705_06720 [Deltaproteobacteria bacterium]|nr:MAG: hypothetical protein D6705_06720 [Deltaproteobacteria bacterium]